MHYREKWQIINLRLPSIKSKNRTRTSFAAHEILSLACLPVPPSRRQLGFAIALKPKSFTSGSYIYRFRIHNIVGLHSILYKSFGQVYITRIKPDDYLAGYDVQLRNEFVYVRASILARYDDRIPVIVLIIQRLIF